jgi:hypothetical protein
MHDHFIDDMVRKLTPVLKNPDRAKTILKRYWRTKMALVWNVEDVHKAANERKRVLTQREAVQILQTLHQQHNPQLGIRWEDLWAHLDLYEPGRKMSRTELSRFVAKDIIAVQK